MVPAYVTMVPLFLVTRNLHLLNTLWAVILPGTADVFGIFLMRQYIQTLPHELEDAARVDGCSELGVLFRIIMPLAKPALAALATQLVIAPRGMQLGLRLASSSARQRTLSAHHSTVSISPNEPTMPQPFAWCGCALRPDTSG